MKKLTILSIYALAAVLVSCSKEAIRQPVTNLSSQTTNNSSTDVIVVSSWFSPVFTIVNDRSSIYLSAHRDHESNLTYNNATQVELAFAKLNYQGSLCFKRLPVMLSASQRNMTDLCEINFGLNNAGCTVTIKNADRNALSPILSNPFPDLQIRYIIIPRTLFESLNVNWDDYAAVALALNI